MDYRTEFFPSVGVLEAQPRSAGRLGSKREFSSWILAAFSLCPHMAFLQCVHIKKERQISLSSSSYKATNPNMQSPPS